MYQRELGNSSGNRATQLVHGSEGPCESVLNQRTGPLEQSHSELAGSLLDALNRFHYEILDSVCEVTHEADRIA